MVSICLEDGSRIYLGFSKRDELRVLDNLRLRFILWWLLTVLLGFAMVFVATRECWPNSGITESASLIGESDFACQSADYTTQDEVAHLGTDIEPHA